MTEQPSTTPGTQAGREGITVDHRSNHPTETCPSCQDALTTAGYALVPVKEALTVERIAEALHRGDVSCEYADDGEGGAVCVYRRHPEDAVAFLAALKGDSE